MRRGTPPQTLEQATKRRARALRVLARGQAGDRRVRIREREHEEAHARAHPTPPDIGLAEIGLRLRLMP